MHITIFGAGYVGLVTGTCLAELGNQVKCVDVNPQRIQQLQAGQCPIHEPGLDELLMHNVQAGRLHFTTDISAAVAESSYLFIAVGTPADEDGSADLQYVLQVAKSIGQTMDSYRLVITKSTVPVGTADKVRAMIQQQLDLRQLAIEFDVVANPEFLREGAAINDFLNSDRIIVGTSNARALAKMQALYAPLNRNHDRLMSMDIRSAELTKYAANAILATKISFMNEMSQIAELVGADIEQVRIGIGSDPRIGYHFINPGCGYGGSCFPKDVTALSSLARNLGYEPQLIAAVDKVNQRQKSVLFTKIQQHFNHQLQGKVIAVWGLAFKPNTDDMREASSRVLMESLWQAGAVVQAYDPVANDEALRIYGERVELRLCDSAEAAIMGADCLVVVTEWKEFYNPDFNFIKKELKHALIFDGRNLYDPDYLKQQGFSYYGIGRGQSCQQAE